jgi:AcrR family transcriptional regulator
MSPDPPRAYVSRLRQANAEATRGSIVRAAGELFVELGYSATTITSVAERAAVSRRTVFSAVGGKPALLKLAWDWAVAGDDRPVVMANRPAVQAIQAESDPQRLVSMWVAFVTEVSVRCAEMWRVLEIAADIDAEVADLRETVRRQRHGGARAFVDHLAGQGGLRRNITRAQAADWCSAHMTTALYRELVVEQGWPLARYRQWLTHTISAALLEPGSVPT